MNEPIMKDAALVPSQASLLTPAEEVARNSHSTTSVTLDPEAAQRFQGHEKVVQAVCFLATEEAQARGLALHHIDVRPAWSHEYDEHTGVVIAAEVKATTDEQFSYWDAIGERLDQLEDALSPEGWSFLITEISFVVSQS